jgi:hypothetical protein
LRVIHPRHESGLAVNEGVWPSRAPSNRVRQRASLRCCLCVRR